jgi:hypothetical protein
MAVESKTEIIPIRVTPTQAKLFRERAESEGCRVSAWLREIARRELQSGTIGQGRGDVVRAA